MTEPLVRVPLTLAAALAFQVSMSPPRGAAPVLNSTLDRPGDKPAMRATARFIVAMLTKGLYWTAALTDTLIVLTPYLPATLPTSLPPISLPSPGTALAWLSHPTTLGLSDLLSPLRTLPPLPLATLAGTTLAIAGALLRHAAYDALGQFYACPNPGPSTCPAPRGARTHAHALITTGPYAVVRHPGYAGLLLCTAGLAVLHLDALGIQFGSAGRGSAWPSGAGVGGISAGMRAVALACALLSTLGAVRRIGSEERALKVRFKGQWEAWAGRVQYKLVPGVY